jgi:hypothetical protein
MTDVVSKGVHTREPRKCHVSRLMTRATRVLRAKGHPTPAIVIPRTLLTLIRTLLTRLGVIFRTLPTTLID